MGVTYWGGVGNLLLGAKGSGAVKGAKVWWGKWLWGKSRGQMTRVTDNAYTADEIYVIRLCRVLGLKYFQCRYLLIIDFP